jgi:hypothetical protein
MGIWSREIAAQNGAVILIDEEHLRFIHANEKARRGRDRKSNKQLN